MTFSNQPGSPIAPDYPTPFGCVSSPYAAAELRRYLARQSQQRDHGFRDGARLEVGRVPATIGAHHVW